MDEAQPQQIFLRNDKGQVWGPLTPASVELLFDNGIIQGKVQISLDGEQYVFPGRVPFVRISIPRALWGETVVPGDDLQHPPPPPPIPGAGTAAMAGQPGVAGAPMAGPGAIAQAASRTSAAMAGPGARANQDRRPLAPNMGQPRPPPVMTPAGAPPVVGAPVMAPPVNVAPPPKPVAAPVVRPPVVSTPVQAAGSSAVPAQGDLATTSPLHLYYLAAATDSTGLLTLMLPERTVEIHFRKGNPELIESSHPDDSLTNFLVRSKMVSFEQLAQAEQQKDRFGGELIGALFGLGLLNPSTAFPQLGQRAANLLSLGLLGESGSFTFVVKDLPPHKAMPLGNKWQLLTQQVRRFPGADVRRRLMPKMDFPVMKSGGRVAASDLGLTPQETRALSYFDGVRSLAQLLHDVPNETDHFLRVAWLLEQLEAIAFGHNAVPPPAAAPPPPAPAPVVAAAPPPPPPVVMSAPPPPVVTAAAPAGVPGPPPGIARPPGPARPVGAPGGAAVRPPSAPGVPGPPPVVTAAPPRPMVPGGPPKITAPAGAPAAPAAPARPAPAPQRPAAVQDFSGEIRQLEELAKKVKDQTHFELFGLTPKADATQIKVAYFKMAKLYHPDTVPPDAPPALAKAKADIFARIGEAQRTLSDDKARAEYVADLEAGGGEKMDIAQILMAEELFQKGRIMVKARKFAEAVKMLDDAIKANPEEGEFYANRGYAKFFASADKKASFTEAMKDINICLKKNEKVPDAWYFQGHMAKVLGDLEGAKRHFKKAVSLNPEHLEAQRELRLIK